MQYCGNAAKIPTRHTRTAVANIHFALAMPHAKCNNHMSILWEHVQQADGLVASTNVQHNLASFYRIFC